MKIFDGLDEAIVGVVRVHALPTRVVYDYDKIITILVGDGGTYEEAVEYFDHNIGCLSIEPDTPAILHKGDLKFVQRIVEDGE